MTDKEILSEYIPENAVDEVLRWIKEKKIHFKITRTRKTKLGDYRAPVRHTHHRITVNHSLNKYAFLITFIHELAHLLVFEKYQNRVAPHGTEWKITYRDLMISFLNMDIFPHDIHQVLFKSIQNSKASSTADLKLSRILHQYDKPAEFTRLEQLATGTQFFIENGRTFQKGEKVRTRYKCLNLQNKKLYLFHPHAPVFPIE